MALSLRAPHGDGVWATLAGAREETIPSEMAVTRRRGLPGGCGMTESPGVGVGVGVR
ncbi:MAG: hypothetical protein AVDCRST_MAG49-2262 [uncultured Thermomicrobiales bacterium]|uniref:Uncharacterized protein n=1 Tax=uncultured Thermomicrobiales bacterium TaxID=1645740 RepID=A0A6J4UW54_9BACT|nr:MAG: hypothetical protein AVDCRST_MAG49-2262 [uncultured Thermomicrobiales bacterium]